MTNFLIFCLVSIHLTCLVRGNEQTFNDWDGTNVVITGAANGIGKGIAERIIGQGVNYIAILDIDVPAGISVQNELNAQYGNIVKFYECDVRSDSRMREVFASVRRHVGCIDVVINDAGIGRDDQYIATVDTNLGGVVSGTLIAREYMSKQLGGKGGTVINIASFLALTLNYVTPVYSATKAGVLHFSSCMGMEEYYNKTGIRVMSICFGFTDTAIVTTARSFDPELTDEMGDLITQERNRPGGVQSVCSAAAGVDKMFKYGKTGDVWLSNADKPAENVTPIYKQWFELMAPYLT